MLSAWLTSIVFSVPILFFFDLHETKGRLVGDTVTGPSLPLVRLRHPVLDRLHGGVAVAGLHEPGLPLHLHRAGCDHRRVLHHHHRHHLEVGHHGQWGVSALTIIVQERQNHASSTCHIRHPS